LTVPAHRDVDDPTNPDSRRLDKVPSYCRHQATGQAVAYFGREEHYLGPYGSKESLALHARLLERFRFGGLDAVRRAHAEGDFTVLDLVAAFIPWARARYTKAPQEMSAFGVATRRLLRLYEDTPVKEFGPLALQTVRSMMVQEGLCRSTVNAAVHRIRRIWRWGVRNQLVHESHWRALTAVPALAEGEEGVRESEPVSPASWRQVRAVLRHAPQTVRVMAKLQMLTGMRPGEVVQLRPLDIQRLPEGWLFRPPQHKTKSRNKQRVVQIGPRAQALLEPLLGDDPAAYVFKPGRAVELYQVRRRYCGTRPAAHDPARRATLRRKRGTRSRAFEIKYSVGVYRTAIRRACEHVWPLPAHLARAKGEPAKVWRLRLGPEAWEGVAAWRRKHLLHPHQLRHSFATRVGNRYGEEEAQILLGHSRLQTTGIYVQRDIRRGRRIIQQVG
jgi:integrase